MNLLNEASDSKFVARKWNIVSHKGNANYEVGGDIIYSTKVLKSNLCDYSDAYILVSGNCNAGNVEDQVAFKNCAPFTKCIQKIDGTTTEDVKDLYLVMSMYNLLEYSSNYCNTTGICKNTTNEYRYFL